MARGHPSRQSDSPHVVVSERGTTGRVIGPAGQAHPPFPNAADHRRRDHGPRRPCEEAGRQAAWVEPGAGEDHNCNDEAGCRGFRSSGGEIKAPAATPPLPRPGGRSSAGRGSEPERNVRRPGGDLRIQKSSGAIAVQPPVFRCPRAHRWTGRYRSILSFWIGRLARFGLVDRGRVQARRVWRSRGKFESSITSRVTGPRPDFVPRGCSSAPRASSYRRSSTA